MIDSGALSDAIREWGFQQDLKKTKLNWQEWKPLLLIFGSAQNALVRQFGPC
jgi:hypothetical protein